MNLKQFLEAFEPDHEKNATNQIEKHSTTDADDIHDKNKSELNDDIFHYSVDSLGLNGSLHSHYTHNSPIGKRKEVISSIDDSLNKAHFDRDTHVFTGIHRQTASHLINHVENHPDKVIKYHHPAYISTSTSFLTAKGFGFSGDTSTIANNRRNSESPEYHRGKHVLKLHLKKGDKAASIRHISNHEGEDEVLIHRGHDIEVHPKPTLNTDGTVVWHGRLVGHNPKKID